VTDFITPNWFAHEHAQGAIDLKNHARTAFQVLSGGYAQRFDPRRGWVQVTGRTAALTHQAHAARGSRRERRARLDQGLRVSDITRR